LFLVGTFNELLREDNTLTYFMHKKTNIPKNTSYIT